MGSKYRFLFFLAILAGCNGSKPGSTVAAPTTRPLSDTLKLTIVPYEAAEKLEADYGPMAAYLARKMGKSAGKFYLVNDYPGVQAALSTGQVDVAYLSALSYALTASKTKLYPIAQPYVKNRPTYHGIIFVMANSPIKSLKDLVGKTFAFGDTLSTTGNLLPRRLLEKEGVPLSKLKRFYNAGNAEMVVKAVEGGSADAGAAYENVWETVYKGHPERAKDYRILGTTEEIPNGVYVARGDLPMPEVEGLRKAFLDMNTDPEGRAAMLRAPNDKIVEAKDSDFDAIRKAALDLGIKIEMLDKKK